MSHLFQDKTAIAIDAIRIQKQINESKIIKLYEQIAMLTT